MPASLRRDNRIQCAPEAKSSKQIQQSSKPGMHFPYVGRLRYQEGLKAYNVSATSWFRSLRFNGEQRDCYRPIKCFFEVNIQVAEHHDISCFEEVILIQQTTGVEWTDHFSMPSPFELAWNWILIVREPSMIPQYVKKTYMICAKNRKEYEYRFVWEI